jgi:hypothetical protein
MAKDTVYYRMGIFKGMLQWEGYFTQDCCVDGNNATSTVRYLLDSVLRGENFGKKC